MTHLSKRHLMFFPAFLLALCCCLANGASAQHYQVRTYQEWDGMPTNPVLDAAQDQRGRMWFSTRVGLTTYDGQSWEVHDVHPNASPQVHSKLVTDSRGDLWSVTSQDPMRISRLHDGQWKTFTYPDLDFRNYIIVGLNVLNQKDGSTLVAITTFLGQILVWDGNQWHFRSATEQPNIIRATEAVGSRLYLATDKGLFSREILQLEQPFELVPDLPPGQVTHLARIPGTETLWVAGLNWLAHWDGNHVQIKVRDLDILPVKDLVGTAALADGDEGLFFGGPGSIHYYHLEVGLETLTRLNGLVADGATSFFRDQENNIWITSTRGVSKLISRRFASYNRESGLLEDEVSAILQLRSGQIVMGHQGGLSFLEDHIRPYRFEKSARALARVMDLHEDQAGNLWIAADRRGLAKLTPKGKITWYTQENGLGLGVYDIFRGQNDTLWVGTSDGLFFKNGEVFENIKMLTAFPGNPPLIRRIVRGPNGSLYLATPNLGILQYEAGRFTLFPTTTGTDGLNSFTCFVKPDGSLWVGSALGLFKIENGKLMHTTEPDPVINRPIFSIMEDDRGNFWFGTDLGVYHWDGRQLTNLNKQDGLLGNETNRNAMIQTKNGNIWIGTDSGASQYRLVFDTPATGSPRLQITGIRIDGEGFLPGEELVLSKPPHTLEVMYQGITFLNEKRIRYRTRLVNFEDQWNEAETSGLGIRNYINVPTGKYQFQVQAVRRDGKKSKIAMTSWIVVKPSLLERWYTRLALVLLGIVIVWVIFALLAGRRYARRLEKEVYQQTWELRLSEESIKSETLRLAATLKNISDGVMAVDFDGPVVLANSAAGEILGLTQSPIIGQFLHDLLPLGSEEAYQSHLRVPHPNLPGRVLEVSSSKVTTPKGSDQAADHGHVIAFRDITDRLHQEEDRIRSQKLESLGVFAGGLAHDFNNLLTVMLGNLSILETSTQIPESEMQMLTLVREASTRAQSLTRQLLTFALGGEPLLETASIGRLVRQSVEFALSGSNVSCHLDLPDNLWPVLVDPGQMDQVFANLVINAVQAMPKGGNIQVTGRNIGSKDSRMVLVEIKDEGTGIEAVNLSRLFDPYFTTKDLGSGLGLAIVYSIITRHEGHITVDTELGVGSIFRVFLQAE